MVKRWTLLQESGYGRGYRALHTAAIAILGVLTVTGVLLYYPQVHTALIPYLAAIRVVHIVLGSALLGMLFVPGFFPPRTRAWIHRHDWKWTLGLVGAISLTGVVLALVTLLPASWRALAFSWHGILTIVLVAWTALHAFRKLVKSIHPLDSMEQAADPERRRFLGWALGGMGAVLGYLLVVPALGAVGRSLGSGAASAPRPKPGGPQPGFVLYTVVDGYPRMPAQRYRLRVTGKVRTPLELDLKELLDLTQTKVVRNFQCVTGWVVPRCHWEGVRISDLARAAGADPRAGYVNFYSFDGVYTESLRRADAMRPDVLLAHRLDGYPLAVEQGAPVRLVVPEMYGYKSIKWVDRVEFSDAPLLGYWEQRGYPSEATIS